MARFYVYSASGDGFSLAYRLTRDGHDVVWETKEPSAQGRGLVPMHKALRPDATVVIDAVGCAVQGRRWRGGHPVFGGNALETWETKRGEGTAVMRQGGLDVPTTHEFDAIPAALRFLHAQDPDAEFYFKPDGLHVPKSMTRKDSARELARFLRWATPQLAKVPKFELQEPIEKGVEIDVAVWLNATGPVAYEVCLEEKKFLAGNKGPSTGCQANVLWSIPARSKLATLLDPFLAPLLASGYVGLAALNTMWTPDATPFGLEWTMRLGYDSTQAAMMLWDDTLGDQLADFTAGRLDRFYRSKDAAMTLRLSCPPQPMEDSRDDKKLEGLPLPLDLLDLDGFLPDDVATGPDGPVCAGGSGFVGVVGRVGRSLSTLRSALVDAAEGVKLTDLMFRPDPVARADEALAFLRKHALCPDPFE